MSDLTDVFFINSHHVDYSTMHNCIENFTECIFGIEFVFRNFPSNIAIDQLARLNVFVISGIALNPLLDLLHKATNDRFLWLD